MNIIQQCFSFLGCRVKDKVTGVEGVMVSLSFDLYGCVQGLVQPVSKDTIAVNGNLLDRYWMDMNRLIKLTEPVMTPPDFNAGVIHILNHGPAGKSLPTTLPDIR